MQLTRFFRAASDVMRLGYIARWNLVPTIQKQDVASHSARVALFLCWAIEKLANDTRFVLASTPEWWLTTLTPMVMATSVLHDVQEVFTGDIPAPYKRMCASLKPPQPLPDAYTGPPSPWLQQNDRLTDLVKHLVKWGDVCETFAFISENNHTPHGKAVSDQMYKEAQVATRLVCTFLVENGWVTEKEMGLMYVLNEYMHQLRFAGTTDIMAR